MAPSVLFRLNSTLSSWKDTAMLQNKNGFRATVANITCYSSWLVPRSCCRQHISTTAQIEVPAHHPFGSTATRRLRLTLGQRGRKIHPSRCQPLPGKAKAACLRRGQGHPSVTMYELVPAEDITVKIIEINTILGASSMSVYFARPQDASRLGSA